MTVTDMKNYEINEYNITKNRKIWKMFQRGVQLEAEADVRESINLHV